MRNFRSALAAAFLVLSLVCTVGVDDLSAGTGRLGCLLWNGLGCLLRSWLRHRSRGLGRNLRRRDRRRRSVG